MAPVPRPMIPLPARQLFAVPSYCFALAATFFLGVVTFLVTVVFLVVTFLAVVFLAAAGFLATGFAATAGLEALVAVAFFVVVVVAGFFAVV
jgi:hypothetical protein